MLLQTPLHAVYATPPYLQTPMNRRRIEPRLQQLLDVVLHFWWLFAGARHGV
jgi:hypothetical protein